MTKYAATPATTATGVPSLSITVPAGVTPSMPGLVVIASGDPVTLPFSPSTSGSGTVTQLDARAAGNSYIGIFRVTGATAGDTVTIGIGADWKSLRMAGQWDDTAVGYGALAVGVRSSSTSSTTSGSLTPASGQRVVVVGVDRTSVLPTVSSVTSSGGETVTQDQFSHDAGGVQPVVGIYFGEFTASAASARTVTVTMSGASTNGLAAIAAVLVAVPTTAALSATASLSAAATTAGSGSTAALTASASLSAAAVRAREATAALSATAALTARARTRVEAWLAGTTPCCAHRGGSKNWPEHTMFAYTNAAAWNRDLALELSVWRTSDGVWVANHDQTTGSAWSANYDIPTTTWATLQTLTSKTGGYPMCRMVDVLDTFGTGDRVFFVDNKANSNVTDFLDTLDAHGGPDHIVSKGFITSTATADAARLRGYKTWGYLYDSDVAVNLPAKVASWDLLGMDYTATSPNWATVLSYGKFTLAHIIDSPTAATTALGKGAMGMMVSDVTGVVPQQSSAATLTATASLSVAAVTTRPAAAALTASASLAAGATPTRPAAAALAATSALSTGATLARPATAALSATAALAATATSSGVGAATASLTATASLSAGATPDRTASAALTATTSLSAAAVPSRAAAAALTASSTLTTTAGRDAPAGAGLTATTALTADAGRTAATTATLTTSATLTASATVTGTGPGTEAPHYPHARTTVAGPSTRLATTGPRTGLEIT